MSCLALGYDTMKNNREDHDCLLLLKMASFPVSKLSAHVASLPSLSVFLLSVRQVGAFPSLASYSGWLAGLWSNSLRQQKDVSFFTDSRFSDTKEYCKSRNTPI